jgi:hypothetical protein
MKIYIFGNGNLSFGDFLDLYATILSPLVLDKENHFLVGDFRGADTLAMEFLKTSTPNVSIFHVGEKPRYQPDAFKTWVKDWQWIGGFANDSARDRAAIEQCTHFLGLDFNSDEVRKSGTQKNIEYCLKLGKINLQGQPKV